MKGEARDLREIIREEMLMADRIIDVLRDGPKTVPEIARAVGYTSREVTIWVMGLRRYGRLTETEEVDDGYYRYRAAVKEGD